MKSLTHIVWIPAGALVAFLASFVFGDLLLLPVDLYYFIYFAIILGFITFYVHRTKLDVRAWVSRRLVWGVLLGIVVGVVMVQNVLSRPETERLTGGFLVWAVFWRGLVYGSVDGILLFTFPWIVVWRALHAEERGIRVQVGAGLLAWVAILFVTTAYHLGYADFRSQKIVQPNVGSTIMSVPTLVSANPVASSISHIFLHVTAVLHSPQTELFLPPPRDREALIVQPLREAGTPQQISSAMREAVATPVLKAGDAAGDVESKQRYLYRVRPSKLMRGVSGNRWGGGETVVILLIPIFTRLFECPCPQRKHVVCARVNMVELRE